MFIYIIPNVSLALEADFHCSCQEQLLESTSQELHNIFPGVLQIYSALALYAMRHFSDFAVPFLCSNCSRLLGLGQCETDMKEASLCVVFRAIGRPLFRAVVSRRNELDYFKSDLISRAEYCQFECV